MRRRYSLKGEGMTETVLTWLSGAAPPHGSKCIVLWKGLDRIHTACWYEGLPQGDCWVTSAGRFVKGMDEVEMYALQPDVSLIRRLNELPTPRLRPLHDQPTA